MSCNINTQLCFLNCYFKESLRKEMAVLWCSNRNRGKDVYGFCKQSTYRYILIRPDVICHLIGDYIQLHFSSNRRKSECIQSKNLCFKRKVGVFLRFTDGIFFTEFCYDLTSSIPLKYMYFMTYTIFFFNFWACF